MTNPKNLMVPVDVATIDEFRHALDYLNDRLIGYEPEVFDVILQAMWQVDPRRAFVRLNAERQPFEAPLEKTLENIAADEAAIDEEIEWELSSEGSAAREKSEAFFNWIQAHEDEQREEYAAWLERYADQFQTDRTAFKSAQRNKLLTSFNAQRTLP